MSAKHINKWNLRKFLIFVLSIQFIIIGLIFLDYLGIHIPFLRQFFGFIYLTFIPGLLILRALKVRESNIIETFLYSVGLSLSSLMFLGLFINTMFKVYMPLSLSFLLLAIGIFVLVLSLICYFRERNEKSISSKLNLKLDGSLNLLNMILILLPFLSFFGTYLMNLYNLNILSLMVMLIMVLIVLYLSIKNDHIIISYYLAVFSISISLLLNNSLISSYLYGWDIQYEYYYASLVLKNSIWNSTLSLSVNSMLSIIMLAPIYSKISNIDIIWLFKTVYPILFSFVPLSLFYVYKKQFDYKTAFLSTFLFMAFFVFYNEMIQLARQQIAELFLVLIIILMLDKTINNTKKSLIFIIFSFSLVVSHYGISYIFIIMLLVVSLLSLFDNHKLNKKLFFNIKKENMKLTVTYMILFIVLSFAWYMYTSNSSNFNSIIGIVGNVAFNINDLLNPASTQGLELILISNSLLHIIAKYIHLTTQALIALGILFVFLSSKKTKIDKNFLKFASVSIFILILSIVLPFFASALNVTRIYHIALIFLAPFFVIGCKVIFGFLNVSSKRIFNYKLVKNPYLIMSLFLSLFFLFNVGFIYVITGDEKGYISFNNNVDAPLFSQTDINGANWISEHYSTTVYADGDRYQILTSLGVPYSINLLNTPYNNLVFIGSYNINNNKFSILVYNSTILGKNFISVSDYTKLRNKVYDSGGTQIS